MGFWLESDILDRHVCLAVHTLKQATGPMVAEVTRQMLVTTTHVNPRVQILPVDHWVLLSLERLIGRGFVSRGNDGVNDVFQPAKAIYQGWP